MACGPSSGGSAICGLKKAPKTPVIDAPMICRIFYPCFSGFPPSGFCPWTQSGPTNRDDENAVTRARFCLLNNSMWISEHEARSTPPRMPVTTRIIFSVRNPNQNPSFSATILGWRGVKNPSPWGCERTPLRSKHRSVAPFERHSLSQRHPKKTWQNSIKDLRLSTKKAGETRKKTSIFQPKKWLIINVGKKHQKVMKSVKGWFFPITSWWFQPLWKSMIVKLGIFPNFRGENKNTWHHHLGYVWFFLWQFFSKHPHC